jgi:DNA-binding LytR/AlgR family response regulator
MKIVIVEDEPLAANKLERQLTALDDTIKVLDKLESIQQAVEWFRKNDADLIFLDIHLSDGNSFQIFEKVSVTTPIVFTTAFDKYAIEAFKLNSLDYLLKPIKKSDLERALNKYRSVFESRELSPPIDFHAVLEAMKSTQKTFKDRFMVFTGRDQIKSIGIGEVAYFYAEGKYVYLIDKRGRQYVVDSSLDRLSIELDPKQFFRINRQFLIGYDAIKDMYTWTKSRVKLELNPPTIKEVVVSVERSSDFKRWLN